MLNGVEVPRFLAARTLAFKALGAVLAVAASLPLGYQGVMLHIGAMIAALLAGGLPYFELAQGAKRRPRARTRPAHCMPLARSTGRLNEYSDDVSVAASSWRTQLPRVVKGLTRHLSRAPLPWHLQPAVHPVLHHTAPAVAARNLMQKRRRARHAVCAAEASLRQRGAEAAPRREGRREVQRVHFLASTTVADQVACGAAAGVAAAFKAPVGGMLYLMELCTRWRLELTWRTFASTCVAALALQVLANACAGARACASVQSFLSISGSRHAYRFSAPYAQLPAMVALAAVGGAAGAGWVALNARCVKLRSRWSAHKGLLLLEARRPPRALLRVRPRTRGSLTRQHPARLRKGAGRASGGPCCRWWPLRCSTRRRSST